MQSSQETISYDQIPDFSHFQTFSEAIEYMASRMLSDGISDLLVLDLTSEKIGLPVMYVVAPFAEYDVSSGIADPGLRLCRYLKKQKRN